MIRQLLLIASLAPAATARADEPPRPRAGLSAEQTERAVRIAGARFGEIRPKAEGAARPDADAREYVVGVERLVPKDPKPGDDAPARAVVTSYRYLDDTTLYATVDLATGEALDVQEVQHMRTPLSDGEYEAAKALARERSEEVKGLFARFGDRVETYAQFSQFSPVGEARVHRVVHILYRVDRRDLSAPRPVVDLTTRTVTVRRPPADPARDRP